MRVELRAAGPAASDLLLWQRRCVRPGKSTCLSHSWKRMINETLV